LGSPVEIIWLESLVFKLSLQVRESMSGKLPSTNQPFVAIDFETADNGPDSACAVGLVRVENSQIVRREKVLIRPPRPYIRFAWLHGISWTMVKDMLPFAEVWPPLSSILDGVKFLAAHNASFDRRVLHACCAAAQLDAPRLPFRCSMQLARRVWQQPHNNLKSLCRRLGIALNHHDPLSDAEACARIVIAAATFIAECPSPLPHAHRSVDSRGPGT
jgi:DNA polymerase-3 subunit epsilon